ncbi:MAG: hypothetical protein WC699_07935 [Bacteroidales bacterium]|jgi:hypothetical protein
MKKFTKSLIFFILLSIAAIPAKSQEENEYLYKPFQITLFPPISTNGLDSKDCVNKLSLNVFWGVNAGLQGVEFGGIANIEKDFMKGAQFAGVANIVRGDVIGLQASHFANIVEGNILGAQVSGFANFNRGNFRGGQYAGFGNFNQGLLFGNSAAGFINTALEVKGLQASGFINIADYAQGAQLSGFMNISDEVLGAQAAGFLNIADEVEGAQVSGFMNVAGNVRGTQVGFINIADNYESGVPIGFINIVKNGYHAFEISGSEIWNLNVGYRLGVDRLYTQFMFGSRWDRHDNFWGFGVGIGSRFGITHYLKGSVDFTSYQLVEHHHLYAQHPNLLEQLRFTMDGKILGNLRWFIGPTFNMLITPYEYPEPSFLEQFTPWSVYENASGVSYIKMWPGLSGGIRF